MTSTRPRVADEEQAAGSGFMTTNWMEQNKALFHALRMERLVTFITIGLIVFVAALNILISLIMMVMEKTRDIAVLMSMGSRKSQSLRDEHAPDLPFSSAQRHQDGDVFGLFHDHHDQRDQNVERCHEHDQADGDERHHAFQSQRAEQRLVLFHPAGGHEAVPGGLFEGPRHVASEVDIVELELDDRDHVAQAKQLLRVRQAG